MGKLLCTSLLVVALGVIGMALFSSEAHAQCAKINNIAFKQKVYDSADAELVFGGGTPTQAFDTGQMNFSLFVTTPVINALSYSVSNGCLTEITYVAKGHLLYSNDGSGLYRATIRTRVLRVGAPPYTINTVHVEEQTPPSRDTDTTYVVPITAAIVAALQSGDKFSIEAEAEAESEAQVGSNANYGTATFEVAPPGPFGPKITFYK